jgi:hypothetical protein
MAAQQVVRFIAAGYFALQDRKLAETDLVYFFGKA